MVGSIGAYSGYDSIFSIGYSARAAAVSSDFQVPESPLTSETAAAPAYDPIQDSVELSRDYPQLVVGQTYTPPMEQQVAFAIRGAEQPSAQAESGEQTDYLNEASLFGSGYGSDASEEADATATAEAGQNGEAEGDQEVSAEEASRGTDANGNPLNEEESAQVREMAQTDREVRAHEQAHQSVGGAFAGGASYGYEQGPDGQRYAVSGEVSIDISAERTAEATVAKMQQVRAAAMAPSDPSGQDYKVAAQATKLEAEARQQMNAENLEAMGGGEQAVDETAASGAPADGTTTGSGLGSGEAMGGTGSASTASGISEGAGSTQAMNRYSQMQGAGAAGQAAQQYQFSMTAGAGISTLSMPENYRSINVVA